MALYKFTFYLLTYLLTWCAFLILFLIDARTTFPLYKKRTGTAVPCVPIRLEPWAEVTPDQRVETFPPGVHQWSDQAVASTSSSLHSSTRRTFWTHTLVKFDICTVHFDSHMSHRHYVCAVAYSGHFCFGGDLTEPSITIASVDRFYLNLVICLQLDIALLIQNSVKIWHCLSELWQCIQGVTFFVDTVYIFEKTLCWAEERCKKQTF